MYTLFSRTFLPFYSIILPCLFLSACSPKEKKTNSIERVYHVFTNVEDIKGNKLIDKESGALFSAAKNAQQKFAFSGKQSLKVDKERPFGFGHAFNAENGNYIVVTAWRKKCTDCGVLTIDEMNDEKVTHQYGEEVIDSKNDWEKIRVDYYIKGRKNDKVPMKAYYFNDKLTPAYVDDFQVEVFTGRTYPDFPELKQLNLTIDKKEYRTLEEHAVDALHLGVLKEKHKEKIKAKLAIDGKSIDVELRLKGDWADHLINDKWSFRVEIDEDTSILGGLEEFSLQNPSTRHFLEEYFLHALADSLDVLNTSYGFVQLSINGKNLGIYAYEEHFTKRLVESRKRREGPIVKFDEEPMWDMQRRVKETGKDYYPPFYAASVPLPFESKKICKKPALYHQFQQANILMTQYKNLEVESHQIFDTKKMGMFLAMNDLALVHHSRAWHNMRYYYNPVINKLEPILFDAFQDHWPNQGSSLLVLLLYKSENSNELLIKPDHFSETAFIKNKQLAKHYFESLDFLVSDKGKQIIENTVAHTKELAYLIQREFPGYTFNDDFFLSRTEKLKQQSDQIKKKLPQLVFSEKNISYDKETDFVYNNINLKVFIDTIKNNELIIENYHNQAIILDEVDFDELKDHTLNKPLDGFNHEANQPSVLTIPLPDKDFDIDEVKYTLVGDDKEYHASIYPWPKLLAEKTVLQQYATQQEIRLPHQIKNDTVWVKPGKHRLINTMVVPDSLTLAIQAGTQIDLVSRAKIICFGNVHFIGTKNKPIEIYSSDATGEGLIVLQTSGVNKLTYVSFSGLNTSTDPYWTLTGGVTFYEADVTMSHVKVENNSCEDALNIIRSHFIIDNLYIKNTASDGFDADYCTGVLKNSVFEHTGNDCIDFSTSEISIDGIQIKDSGDKGISGGEASTLTIANVNIDGATIGIASKDKSELDITNLTVKNATYGLAVFQKKPEYGPGIIRVKILKLEQVEHDYILEIKSLIKINEQTIIGDKKLDIEQLYEL